MRILFFSVLFFANIVYAEKFNLICDAFDYGIETELNNPLGRQSVRYVGQTTAGFLDSDTYSLSTSTECKGKGEDKTCLVISDSHYCPKPDSKFKFRSLKLDQSVVMISDRCDGSWTKYQKIGEKLGDVTTMAFMEETTYFQIKNQIYSGISFQKDKPVFLLNRMETGDFDAKLVSFRKDLWSVNIFDPLRAKNLKVDLESYENNIHEQISLSSSCTAVK